VFSGALLLVLSLKSLRKRSWNYAEECQSIEPRNCVRRPDSLAAALFAAGIAARPVRSGDARGRSAQTGRSQVKAARVSSSLRLAAIVIPDGSLAPHCKYLHESLA
jgi:hypothetical protein